MAFILEPTPAFARKLKKLTTKNQLLIPIITTKLKLLAQNPKNPTLKFHKVLGNFSSSITGDIRVIWRYKDESRLEIEILELIDIGGHDEVY